MKVKKIKNKKTNSNRIHTKKTLFKKKTGEKRQDTPSNSNKKPKDENKTTQEQRKKIIEHDKSD